MGDLFDSRDPAVDGHDEAATLFGEARDRVPLQAVSLVEPARHVSLDVGAQLAKDQHGERRRADPVRVVVAVDADPLARRNRRADRVAGLSHVPELERIVLGKLRLEEGEGPLGLAVPAADEHARRDGAELQLLGERVHELPRGGVAQCPKVVRHGQPTVRGPPDGARRRGR